MTHPDDLLADHVDGTLTDRERAVVETHLESCARCREEVELARAAVSALRELEDVPVPLGVTDRVIPDARTEVPRRPSIASRWQWAAGLAAAAAIVAVIAVNIGGPTGPDGIRAAAPAETAAGGGSDTALSARPVPLEDQRDVNYDGDDGVLVLAREAIREFQVARDRDGDRSAATGATADAGAAEAGATLAAPMPASGLTVAEVDPAPAIRCLRRADVPPADSNMTLVRLVEARYVRDPVYLAVFLQGPGAGQPPDRAVVWVLDRSDCRIVNFLNVTFDAVEAAGTT